jgi:hypothetical protein
MHLVTPQTCLSITEAHLTESFRLNIEKSSSLNQSQQEFYKSNCLARGLSTKCGQHFTKGYAHGSRLSAEVRKMTKWMVTQGEHKIYPGSGHKLRNTLCPASLWIVLMRDEMF